MKAEDAEDSSDEQHHIWKVNSSLLYDFVGCLPLEAVSLTVDWFPGIRKTDSGINYQRMLIGTMMNPATVRAHECENALHVLEVPLPAVPVGAADRALAADGDVGELSSFNIGGRRPAARTVLSIPHPAGEVNRARLRPYLADWIITTSTDGICRLFRVGDYESGKVSNTSCVELMGHMEEAWACSWNKSDPTRVASAGQDYRVCLWNIEAPRVINKSHHRGNMTRSGTAASAGVTTVDSAMELTEFNAAPNDVVWTSRDTLAAVDEGGSISIFDLRAGIFPVNQFKASDQPLNVADYHSQLTWLLAASGCDPHVGLWDLRYTKNILHAMWGQRSPACAMQFHPTNSRYLATACTDGRVSVWDFSAVGTEQVPEDERDGPPELLFSHGGHRENVPDIAWNMEKEYDMYLASTGEDSILQYWKPNEGTFLEGDPYDLYYVNEGSDVE